MRIRCSFIVEPELHTHHQYAIDILRAWQKQEKEMESHKEVMIARSNAFHQSLYLSGLYLHKLSPDLPKLVSELLPNDELSVEPLLWQLAQVGIKQKPQDAVLSQPQWQQLTSMLEKHNVDQTEALKTEQGTVFQHDEGLTIQTQLDNIASVQQQLLDRLNKLEVEGASKAVPSLKTSDFHKVNLNIESIKASQQDLIKRVERLGLQLKSSSQVAPLEKAEVDSLDTQLKRARSVKAKGLW
ncbi:hypothetical protein [uncultured Shewanella sp.]|uniref:hypothetical protein n=1 Tax=uncultured Shewanella sp. TaxID=173975 RepID=UPI0026206391|nr:hypothetical protein [uncultured Shewanella sp.]